MTHSSLLSVLREASRLRYLFNQLKRLHLRCFHSLIVLPLSLVCSDLSGQTYEKLNALKGHQVEVYFSAGADAKATRMAEQLDRVISYYRKHLGFSPSVKLLILSPGDWQTYAKNVVYGLAHYGSSQTLFVASEDNDFWRSFIPPLDKTPKEFSRLISETYVDKKGKLTMEPFFDLLAIHELGHAYQMQDSLVIQRKWMGELFANLFLHTYIAEMDPQLLPALTVFPKMVVSTTDRATLKYTSLAELEKGYDEIAQKYPRNYGWYQCRWHIAAGNIYDEAGVKAIEKLWTTLRSQRVVLDEASFITMLTTHVHPGVADVSLKWNDTSR